MADDNTDRNVELRIPHDAADYLGPRSDMYKDPKLTFDDGTSVDLSKPGPFAVKKPRRKR